MTNLIPFEGDPLKVIPLDKDLKPVYVNIQGYRKLVNTPPNPKWIKVNKYSQGAKYIPIRIVEQLLDRVFVARQVIQVGEPKILGNAVVISVQLNVYHPFLGWLSYAGVGAVPIELKATKYNDDGNYVSGARTAIDFENINAKALHKNVPSALSFAVSNAAKKIGPLFGSQINSKADETL